jgi:outer membrane lipoprotein carrier protein
LGVPVIASPVADSLIAEVREQLAVPCMAVEFKVTVTSLLRNGPVTSKGKLLACEDGKFRLESRYLTVVSNGVSLWRYAAENNQVVINNASGEDAALNPLSLLKSRENEYTPTSVLQTKLEGKPCWEIGFSPKEDDAQVLKIYLSVKNLIPVRIDLSDTDGNSTRYDIQRFQEKQALPETTFTFSPPKGVEVIDMRDSQ